MFETARSFLGDGHRLKLFLGVWESGVKGQHLLLVVALRLDLNDIDLVLLGGGHQDRRLDKQPTGKVRSECETYFDHNGKQAI